MSDSQFEPRRLEDVAKETFPARSLGRDAQVAGVAAARDRRDILTEMPVALQRPRTSGPPRVRGRARGNRMFRPKLAAGANSAQNCALRGRPPPRGRSPNNMRDAANPASFTSIPRSCGALIAAALLATGCADQPKKDAGATAAPPPASTAPPVVAPRPAEPELSPAQARAQSQKLALEAVDQLQSGDEIAARQTLAKALALDPANEIAKKMNDQIEADAQKELGADVLSLHGRSATTRCRNSRRNILATASASTSSPSTTTSRTRAASPPVR